MLSYRMMVTPGRSGDDNPGLIAGLEINRIETNTSSSQDSNMRNCCDNIGRIRFRTSDNGVISLERVDQNIVVPEITRPVRNVTLVAGICQHLKVGAALSIQRRTQNAYHVGSLVSKN
jgi:hypothetical protein